MSAMYHFIVKNVSLTLLSLSRLMRVGGEAGATGSMASSQPTTCKCIAPPSEARGPGRPSAIPAKDDKWHSALDAIYSACGHL